MRLLTPKVKSLSFVRGIEFVRGRESYVEKENPHTNKDDILSYNKIIALIDEEKCLDTREYITKHVDILAKDTFVMSSATRFNLLKLSNDQYTSIVNLKKINSFKRINKFFEAVNEKLPVNGLYINSVEIYTNRKKKIFKRFPTPFNRVYYLFDVFYTRVMPKLPGLKKIYFWTSKSGYRVLSKAETFGRLYSCGFEILDETFVGNELYFVARKVRKPFFDNKPTYGLLVWLKRHGKNGRIFNTYKLRTMYAYSEYLQEYVFEHNHLQNGGKFKDDFRITTEGKFLRKFWLDELPMIINLLRGDIKLVGVRPLSDHYFSLYSEELKRERIKYKPGLIPPFYVDLPDSLEEIMASEMRYLKAYEKNPVLTDIKYFFKAWRNIIFKGIRSA